MWYVVQVKTGTEESVRVQYEKHFPQLSAPQCMIPRYEEMKKYKGEWHKEKKILFPGYVLIPDDDADRLYEKLQQVIGFTKLLGTGKTVVPLSSEEERFLWDIGGPDQVVPVSKGILENDRVIVTEGPLKGREGLIKRIDRHRRKAWLEMTMFGKLQRVEMGLEVVEKLGENTGF